MSMGRELETTETSLVGKLVRGPKGSTETPRLPSVANRRGERPDPQVKRKRLGSLFIRIIPGRSRKSCLRAAKRHGSHQP